VALSSKDFVSPIEVIATTTAFFDGEINLDPASSDHANALVQAHRYFTWEQNGLNQSWKSKNIYLYPPRDICFKHEQPKQTTIFNKPPQFKKSNQRIWLEQAYKKWLRKEFEQAIIFLTSVEVALLSTQRIKFDFPLCVMKDKPKLFIDNEKLEPLKNCKVLGFLYLLPPINNFEQSINKFTELYSTLGRVYT
jgi:hypothetical protein